MKLTCWYFLKSALIDTGTEQFSSLLVSNNCSRNSLSLALLSTKSDGISGGLLTPDCVRYILYYENENYYHTLIASLTNTISRWHTTISYMPLSTHSQVHTRCRFAQVTTACLSDAMTCGHLCSSRTYSFPLSVNVFTTVVQQMRYTGKSHVVLLVQKIHIYIIYTVQLHCGTQKAF